MIEPTKTGEHYGLPDEPFNHESVNTWILALYEARDLKSEEIDTCHFIAAFLKEKPQVIDVMGALGLAKKQEEKDPNGLAYKALVSLGANYDDAKRHLIEVVGYGQKPHKITKLVGRIPLDERPNTPRVLQAAKQAVVWSKKLGSHKIGDEHILLGILDEPDQAVIEILDRLNIEIDQLRHTLLRLANNRPV